MPVGSLKRAAAPLPSALPLEPALPARVVTTPAGVILRMVLLLLVGDVEVAGDVNGDAGGKVEARRGAAAVGAASGAGHAGQSRDHCGAGGRAAARRRLGGATAGSQNHGEQAERDTADDKQGEPSHEDPPWMQTHPTSVTRRLFEPGGHLLGSCATAPQAAASAPAPSGVVSGQRQAVSQESRTTDSYARWRAPASVAC